MIQEEVQYINNQRQGNYQNYNNQGYIPHLMIGQEQGSSSNAMPRQNLYEKTSKLEVTFTQFIHVDRIVQEALQLMLLHNVLVNVCVEIFFDQFYIIMLEMLFSGRNSHSPWQNHIKMVRICVFVCKYEVRCMQGSSLQSSCVIF